MARFDGVYALGYNSAGSEPIWMKFGALLSALSGAGTSRFWTRSAKKRASEAKFYF